MASPLLSLPQQQIDALAAAYARAASSRRRAAFAIFAAVIALASVAAYVAEVRLSVLIDHIDNFISYFASLIPTLRWSSLLADLKDWMWGLPRWSRLLFDTLLMAYLATLLGALCALALCFLAPANLISNPALRFAVRRFFEFCRTVPDLVFALIFVRAFGLGAMAGVLALMVHTAGSLGKLFYEVAENIDMKPLDGVRASGGNWTQTVRYGALPQLVPAFLSYGLLRFELNVRTATVLGFVGAGGIGQDFLEAIRGFYYSDVSAILVLIILTVFIIDIVTGQLRKYLIAGDAAR